MNLSKFDLQIKLSPSQLLRIEDWLVEFYSKCKSRMSSPVVEEGVFKISSADIYNFLSALDVTEENRFDWYKLKKMSVGCIRTIASKKKDILLITYYKDCKILLTDFDLRYLRRS